MKSLRYISLTILLFICGASSGQSGSDSTRITLGYPVYSQYLQNGLIINPAYAGTRDALSIAVSRRNQWLPLSGSGSMGGPVLTTISLHTPMKNDKVAIGLKAEFMDYGVTSAQSVYLVYAYHIMLATGKLSFGLKAGFDRSTTNYSLLKGIAVGDPVFSGDVKPYFLPNAGAGVYYYNKSVFAGISVPSFLFYRNIGNGKTQAYHSFREYDIMATAGGLISFSEDFRFKPSILIDYSLRKSAHINQLDLNGNFIIADVLWIGGSYRTTEQVAVGIIQVQATQQLMFGISYDFPAGRMVRYSNGSAEVFLRYEFGSKVSTANPRYF